MASVCSGLGRRRVRVGVFRLKANIGKGVSEENGNPTPFLQGLLILLVTKRQLLLVGFYLKLSSDYGATG